MVHSALTTGSEDTRCYSFGLAALFRPIFEHSMGDASGCAVAVGGGGSGGGLEVLLQAAEFVEQKPSAGIDSSPSDRSLFDGKVYVSSH